VSDGPLLGEAEIRFPELTPDAHGFAIFEGRSSGEKVRLPCELYGGKWFAPVLSPRQRGLRIVIDGGEVTFMPRGEEHVIKLTYSLPHAGDRMPLAQAVRRAKIAKLLAEPLGCQLWPEIGGQSPASPIDLSGADFGETVLYAEVILCAARVAAAVDLDQNVDVEPMELLEQAQPLLAAGTRHKMTVSGGPAVSGGDSTAPGVVLLPNEVILGPYRITNVIGVTGVVSADPDSGRFEVTGVPEILKSRTTDRELDAGEECELWVAAVAEVHRRGITNWFIPRGVLEEPGSEELEKT
jgi:hypothetical protein